MSPPRVEAGSLTMKAEKISKPLTTRTIEALKPGAADLADVGEYRGLRVTCGRTGLKTFFYRYNSPETQKLVQAKIGNYPDVSLAQARAILQEWKLQRRHGICPAAQIKRAKQEAQEREESINRVEDQLTIQGLIELYLTEYIEDKRSPNGKILPGARKPKGQSETRRTLYGDAVPELGSRPASEISRQDVVDLVMKIVRRGANVQAGNVLRELSAAYEFAIGIGRLPNDVANPALLAKASLRQAKVKLTHQPGKRILSDKELIRLLAWLPDSAFTPAQKNIIKLTLYTGCRSGELCAAEWGDVDFKKKTLHLRETKTDVERYVQLPRQAVDLLKKLPSLGKSKYLFPSQRTGLPVQQKKLTEQTWVMRKKGIMLDLPRWTPHDLRRTVRTSLARLQCPNEVAEAILGHSRSGIEGTYDLHRYEKESRHWLQVWANYLDELTL